MHISGHVQMMPEIKPREWARTSFVAAFNTFMGETLPHPTRQDITIVQLGIKQFDYNRSTHLERWVEVPSGWESGFRETLFPEFYCQIMGDYSVSVTLVNVPASAIWCELLEKKPT